jgi:hypothetical protein
MAALAAVGAWIGSNIGTVASTAGGLLTAGGSIAAGQAENNSAKFEAQQMEAKAKEEKAAAQRDAEQKRREGTLINSRQQALAAASGAGAGADAPTIVKLMSDTAGQSEYGANSVLYGGNERAAGLNDSAGARRRSGKASLLGSQIAGFGQGFGTIGKAFA